jgi:SMP-30/Gluconolactonase/LRE-like region
MIRFIVSFGMFFLVQLFAVAEGLQDSVIEMGPLEKLSAGFSFTEGPAFDSDGNIYFTDPYYHRAYWKREKIEQPGQYVYFVSPDRSEVRVVEDRLVRPNGITGSPDGKILYITASKGFYRVKFK